MATKLTKALNAGVPFDLNGTSVVVKYLTFKQLAQLEAKYGALTNLPLSTIQGQIEIATFLLNASGNAGMTEDSVGEMLTSEMLLGENSTFQQILIASGLFEKVSPKNDPKPETSALTSETDS